MLKGFRDFILRGNVIDLAVAVVIGSAFTQIVNAIVAGFITPLIGLILRGNEDASRLNTQTFLWGDIVTAVINFVLVAAVLYFFVVVPMNRLLAQFKGQEKPAAAEPSNQEKLLAEIRDELRAHQR